MIVKARRVTITNDVGGTTEVDGPFKVKVTARYIDDEIGAVVHGQLVDEKDIWVVLVFGFGVIIFW